MKRLSLLKITKLQCPNSIISPQLVHFVPASGAISIDCRRATTLLITPTAGAARNVVNCLDSPKSQSLVTCQPMKALLPEREDIATPIERCLAWAKALRNLPASKLRTLFWKESPQSTTELLKAGRNFNGLCDRLAEAGLSPLTFELPAQASGIFDQGRWSAIAALYPNYINCLACWGLRDPNDLRLDQIKEPTTPPFPYRYCRRIRPALRLSVVCRTN